jgi:YHS domain-containing protein
MLGAPANPPGDIQRVSRLAKTSFRSIGQRWHHSQDHERRKGEVMATVTDPVCGMEIDSAAAAASEEYGGKTYYFCSEGCHQRFVAAPEQYAV